MLNLFRPFLSRLRDKWREVPVNEGRVFSRDLLAMDQATLIRTWQDNDASPERRWYRERYAPQVKDKDVLDLGCGFSVDGIHFLRSGARVTFADIVEDNRAATRRGAVHFTLPAEHYFFADNQRCGMPHSYALDFALAAL